MKLLRVILFCLIFIAASCSNDEEPLPALEIKNQQGEELSGGFCLERLVGSTKPQTNFSESV